MVSLNALIVYVSREEKNGISVYRHILVYCNLMVKAMAKLKMDCLLKI